jgi:hypothetical protein
VLLQRNVIWLQFESVSQGRARRSRLAAHPVLGRGLNQRRHRVAARHARRQWVVGIAGVKRGRLLIAAHRLFKLLADKLLAGRKVELCRFAPVGVAHRCGRHCCLSLFCVNDWSRRRGRAGCRVLRRCCRSRRLGVKDARNGH